MAVEIGLKVCRKCLTTEGLTSLFEGKSEVLEMLQILGRISIAKDKGKFEAMICGNCSEELMKLSRDSWKIKNIERLYVQKKRVEIGGEDLEEEEGIEEDSGIVRGSGGSSKGSDASKSRGKSRKGWKIQGNSRKGQFECKICNKIFPAKINLQKHIDFRHVQRKNFNCDLCGKWYFNKHQIRTHMINNHTVRHIKTLDESRPFKCSKCSKGYTSLQNLKLHVASVHEADRPFVCKCGKSFKFSWNLKGHQAVHSNVRPFKCHCGKSFKVEGLLKTHKINVHAELF